MTHCRFLHKTFTPASGKKLLKNTARQILNFIWSMKKASLSNRIIYYHSIHPQYSRSHRPDVFLRHLQWLRKKGYRSILVRDIPKVISASESPSNPWVAISFDDGYQDNVDYALPILKQEGFLATFFIVSRAIQKKKGKNSSLGYMLYEDRPMMTERDIGALRDAGMEIGSHSASHRLMTDVYRYDLNQCLDECLNSKHALEAITGVDVSSFSYPNGQKGAFSAQTSSLLRKCNYKIGLTTIWGIPNVTSNLFELPRCEISVRDSLSDFRAKMSGLRDYNRFIGLWFQRSRIWKTT